MMDDTAVVLLLVVFASLTSKVIATEIVYSFNENNEVGSSVGNIGHLGTDFSFRLSNEPESQCEQYFTILASGEIQTLEEIDREKIVEDTNRDSITCVVDYTNNNGESVTLFIKFIIQDINDEVPRLFGLDHPVHNLTIYENLDIGQPILYLMPYDLDDGASGQVIFNITSGNEEGYFRMDPPLGETESSPDRLIYLAKTLDYEEISVFNLTFNITDRGTPSLSSSQRILVYVGDINDQSPSFSTSEFTFDVRENQTVGREHPFGKISATDDDSATHAQIFYQFDETASLDSDAIEIFGINTTTGELYLIKELDFDSTTKVTYNFRIEARNPGSPAGTNAEITVNVLDVNDNSPFVTVKALTIDENQPSSLIVLKVEDDDKEPANNGISNASVTFYPPVKHDAAEVNTQNSLTTVRFTITEPLDRELTPSIIVTISVRDTGTPHQTSHTNITITILDENDNAPQFTQMYFASKLPESAEPVRSVLTVSAEDPDEGANGEFYFTLIETEPILDINWFELNSTSGEIFLVNRPNHDAVSGLVQLTIMATDTGSPSNTNTTIVDIQILPPITFQPVSYQEYNGIDILSSSIIYLEFRSDKSDSLLFYQQSIDLEHYASLQLIDNGVVYSHNGVDNENSLELDYNIWYSVLIDNQMDNPLSVWERDNMTITKSHEILQTSILAQCNTDISPSDDLYLHVGGVDDAFSIPEGRLNSYDFIGSIATVVVDGVQLDLTCPSNERNTLLGSYLSAYCDTDPCNEHSSCVSYTNVPLCQCIGGFGSDSCDEETDFGSITLTNGSYIDFELGYEFFFNKFFINPTEMLETNTLQTIRISFIPRTVDLVGVIFYSKTTKSVQRLEIDKTIRYTVSDINYKTTLSLVSEEVTLLPRIENHLVLEITNNEGGVISLGTHTLQVSVNTFGGDLIPHAFAKEPMTLISIGGTTDEMGSFVKGNFTGCVTHFSIDDIEIPLRGLVNTGNQNLRIRGPSNGVSTFCHPCYEADTCPTNSNCDVQGSLSQGEYTCNCIPGYELFARNNTCILIHPESTISTPTRTSITRPTVTDPPITDGVDEPTSSSALKLHYIIIIAIGGLIILSLTLTILAVTFRCAYIRGRRKQGIRFITQVTYHTKDNNPDEDNKICENTCPPRSVCRNNDYVNTRIRNSTEEIDGDFVIEEVPSICSYRKSTSQETGFHTASELDGTSRRTSPRRMSDSKESSELFDSDYSPFETDSESLTTSGIEDALSPHDMRLVSSGSMMGVPSSFRRNHPLSPKERQALTPLRPNSGMLLTEDETDTEVSTTTNTTNRRLYNDNDSLRSDSNGTKWYKSNSPSTIVDRESNTPYGIQTAVLHRPARHLNKPPNLTNLKQYKNDSPPHHMNHIPSVHNNHHIPLSSSPLVQAQRLDYHVPVNFSPTRNHPFHYDHMEPPRLPVINESVPMQYPSYHQTYHPRQHSDHTHMEMEMVPIHIRGDSDTPYYVGYQGTNLTPGGEVGSTRYRDLNSFSLVNNNPIAYWEQQQRLRPTVDDPLHFLKEPYTKFEDVSTTPSVVESTLIEGGDDNDSPNIGSGLGGMRRPYTSRAIHNDYVQMHVLNRPPRSRRNSDRDSTPTTPTTPTRRELNSEGEEEYIPGQTKSSLSPPIFHFPSADCSPTLTSPNDSTIVDSNSTLAGETSPHHMNGLQFYIQEPKET